MTFCQRHFGSYGTSYFQSAWAGVGECQPGDVASLSETCFLSLAPQRRTMVMLSRPKVPLTAEDDNCVLLQLGLVRLSQLSLWLEHFRLPSPPSNRAWIWPAMVSWLGPIQLRQRQGKPYPVCNLLSLPRSAAPNPFRTPLVVGLICPQQARVWLLVGRS